MKTLQRALAMVSALVPLAMGLSVEPNQVSLLTFDTREAKKRPVKKVITLLKDMLTQMDKEAEEDKEIYDKMACWCETNDKEKTKTIGDAEARISELTSTKEELTAASARMGTEMEGLKKEIAADQEALDKSTAMRTKQQTEFSAEEKDLLGSASALASALSVLGKKSSMLQVPESHLLGVAATLTHELEQHSQILEGVITPSDRRAIGVFSQAPEDYLGAPTALTQSKATGNGDENFGILKQMKETFDQNLASAQKDEAASQKAFEDLRTAKETQIEAGQAQLDTKEQEFAETNEKKAQATQDLDDTEKSLAKDQEFMAMLKEKCTKSDAEFEERQKARQLEVESTSKAVSILSSDDAHDLFTKTFNPSLLQTRSRSISHRRNEAAKLLNAMAVKASNPRLATLAQRVQMGAFTRVKKAISDMVTQLQKEQEDETKHRDFCIKEKNDQALETERKIREKETINTKIQDLEQTIKEQSDGIEAIDAEISELEVNLKSAKEDREKQSKDFQMTVADQRATQKLLTQALNVLKSFYNAKAAALLQRGANAAHGSQPAPMGGYKTSDAAGGVMGLLQQIINEAKGMEQEAMQSEEDAAKVFEGVKTSTNDSIEQANKDKVHKSKVRAKAESNLVQANADKDGVVTEQEQLANYDAELHSSCDFITNGDNYEVRQTARSEEMEALKQAKAILSGATFNAFLQATAT